MKRLQVGDECYVRTPYNKILLVHVAEVRGKCRVVKHEESGQMLLTSRYKPQVPSNPFILNRCRIVAPTPIIKQLAK
jgi:hypothetical protein